MTITTPYGELRPDRDGKFSSESFHKLEIAHFSDKVNYRKAANLEDQINDRTILKQRMKAHPDKNHAPTKYNQIIRL